MTELDPSRWDTRIEDGSNCIINSAELTIVSVVCSNFFADLIPGSYWRAFC